MDFQLMLKEAGPYTAPLCGAMGWAIRWLLKDRIRLLKALSDSSERERQCAATRTVESLESAHLLSESNKTQQENLTQHDRVLEQLIQRIDRWLSSKG